MRMFVIPSLVLACLLSSIVPTLGSSHDRLLGHWKGDADASLKAQGMEVNEDTAEMVEMLKAMLGGMKFEFTSDSMNVEMDMMGEVEREKVAYKIVEATDDTLKIENLDGEKAGRVATITFIDDNHISMAMEDEMDQLFLVRASTEEAPPAPSTEQVETTPASEDTQPAAPRFAVMIPERIDQQWYWVFHTDQSQHIVQSAVERSILNAGLELVELNAAAFGDGSVDDIASRDYAIGKAAQIGATHVITGTAIADKLSESVAYGVKVVRASAQVTAKIVRVSDGKVISVAEATAQAGGQALAAAGRDALKAAAKDVARKLTRAASQAAAAE